MTSEGLCVCAAMKWAPRVRYCMCEILRLPDSLSGFVCVCLTVIEDLCVVFREKTIIVGAGSRPA